MKIADIRISTRNIDLVAGVVSMDKPREVDIRLISSIIASGIRIGIRTISEF